MSDDGQTEEEILPLLAVMFDAVMGLGGSAEAFAKGAANRGKPLMVFDWDTAARIIKARNARVASAGLRGDWGGTGGEIYRNGAPINRGDTYVYIASTWAVPELNLGDGPEPCFLMEDEIPDEWGLGESIDLSGIYWPESARKILGEDGEGVWQVATS